jgi:hypothetical protein
MNTPNTMHTGPFIPYDWRGFNFFAQLDEPQVDAGGGTGKGPCCRSPVNAPW